MQTEAFRKFGLRACINTFRPNFALLRRSCILKTWPQRLIGALQAKFRISKQVFTPGIWPGGTVFFACGLFYYFKTEQVKALFLAMKERFPGGCIIFDTAGKAALKMMIKSVVENSAGIEGVDAYFHAGDPKKDIVPWIGDARVTYKSYMLGYNDLRMPGVSGMFRLLSKIGDGPMRMKIVKIEF